MSAKIKMLTGAAGLAALVGMATPAAAQYYPGTGYGYPGQGYGYGNQGVVGQIVNSILGYGRYPHGNYGYNSYRGNSQAIDQCARAVEARLNGSYGGYNQGYGGYGGYNQGYGGYGGGYGDWGYGQGVSRYGGGQVQGITRVENKSYGLKVWGVASSGYRGYDGWNRQGYGNYGYNQGADLKWDCEVDYRGRIRDLDINRRSANWRGY